MMNTNESRFLKPMDDMASLWTRLNAETGIAGFTPPLLLAAAMRMGLTPVCSAVIFCKLPKRTLLAVSLPVSATPSQPRSVPKNG